MELEEGSKNAEHYKRWNRLLTWANGFQGFDCRVKLEPVEGAGMGLVNITPQDAEATLLVIPAPALLNPLTLLASPGNTIPKHLFPQSSRSHTSHTSKKRRTSKSKADAAPISAPLNTTQLLTLHLALTRDSEGRHPSDWHIYLDTIPKAFRPWHPLTWLIPPCEADFNDVETENLRRAPEGKTPESIKTEEERRGWLRCKRWAEWKDLFDQVPMGAQENARVVKERFDADLVVLRRVLREEEPFKSQNLVETLTRDDLLWAWLSVNTRSVSLDLGYQGPTELYNHTLVPILDLVNHSSRPSECILKPRQIPTPGTLIPKSRPSAHNTNPHLIPGKIAFSLLTSERGMAANEELRFEYHGHCNTELWAEYGFVERPLTPAPGHRHGKEILVKGRWSTMKYSMIDVGSHINRIWKFTTQREEKEEILEAIGCWKRTSIHAHPYYEPSHGLQMTLRLYFFNDAPPDKLKAIRQGLITYISEENEDEVDEYIYDMMNIIKEDAEATKRLLHFKDKDLVLLGGREDMREAVQTMVILWDEHLDIAEEYNYPYFD